MEGSSSCMQDTSCPNRDEKWSSIESDVGGQAESEDRVNNNEDPFEGDDLQEEGLLLAPGSDLMREVVGLFDFKQTYIPFRVDYGKSETVENSVRLEGTSETEESPDPRDQTENENHEYLSASKDAIQEAEDGDKEAMMRCAGFAANERGLYFQIEESDMNSDSGRDSLGPDVRQPLEMNLSKQTMSIGRELDNNSSIDQEGHEKDILNSDNKNDVDKTPTTFNKPEPLNEKGCTRATREECMESRLSFNRTLENNVHLSDTRDNIVKLALSSESQLPTVQILEDMDENIQEYCKVDLATEEPFCKNEVETTVRNLEIKSFIYDKDFIVKVDFSPRDHLDLHPEQESNQYATASIIPADTERCYECPGAMSSYNLKEQIKEPTMYEQDHIQMKYGSLFPKKEEVQIESDDTLDEEMQEVHSTGSSNLETEETAMFHGSVVPNTAPEQDLSKMFDTEMSFHHDRDEEQQSSETEDDLNMEADGQLWPTDLMQWDLQFHSASSSHQLEEESLEEGYDNGVNKERSRDGRLHTDSLSKCSDDQESKEDSDEVRRRHDIADKLDPEVLHLLEMHLLKQQLVVIKEEQEEELGFDDLHINAQNEYFEALVGSRKFTSPLDMVLEEPEPGEENHQAVGSSEEVDFKDVALLEQDPDREIRFSEAEYHEMDWNGPVELSFKIRSANIAREDLDKVIQESQGESSEQSLGISIEEMIPCTEMFENRDKDAEKLEAEEITGDINYQRKYKYKHVMVVTPGVIGTTPKYSLEERSSKSTQIEDELDKLKHSNFALKEENPVSMVEEVAIHSIRKLESEGFGEPKVAFESQHRISVDQSTKKVSQDRKEDMSSEITGFGEEANECFGVTTTFSTETESGVSSSRNWNNQMAEADEGPEFLGSNFSAENMEQINLFKDHILETLYSIEKDHSERPKDLPSKSASKGSLEAEDQQTVLKISAAAATETIYKALKDGQATEREVLETASESVTQNCSTAVENPLHLESGYGDFQDQLSDAMEKAMASERRASHLQAEVEYLRQENRNLHAAQEILHREKSELLLLLSEQKRCQPERGTNWVEESQTEVMKMPLQTPRVSESTVLREAEEEGQNTSNKGAEHLAILCRELDFVRQENHTIVAQLTSLQQQLQTLRQANRKQPSNIMCDLLRMSLVAALGILLFWWVTDQLG